MAKYQGGGEKREREETDWLRHKNQKKIYRRDM
jgi:hypothetical protein